MEPVRGTAIVRVGLCLAAVSCSPPASGGETAARPTSSTVKRAVRCPIAFGLAD
jgi:hypothetical protein